MGTLPATLHEKLPVFSNTGNYKKKLGLFRFLA